MGLEPKSKGVNPKLLQMSEVETGAVARRISMENVKGLHVV